MTNLILQSTSPAGEVVGRTGGFGGGQPKSKCNLARFPLRPAEAFCKQSDFGLCDRPGYVRLFCKGLLALNEGIESPNRIS